MIDSISSGDSLVVYWDIDLLVSSDGNVFAFPTVALSDCDKVCISAFWSSFVVSLSSRSVADKFFSCSDGAAQNS